MTQISRKPEEPDLAEVIRYCNKMSEAGLIQGYTEKQHKKDRPSRGAKSSGPDANPKRPSNRDCFVNITKLHEQTGGLIESINLNLRHIVECRLRGLLECSWCPADIKEKIEVTVMDMREVLAKAARVQIYMASHSQSIPDPVPLRCPDRPRLFQLTVIHGDGSQDIPERNEREASLQNS